MQHSLPEKEGKMHIATRIASYLLILMSLTACQDLNVKQVEDAVKQAEKELNKPSNKEMLAGMKTALDQGIATAVSDLGQNNGFNSSDLVRLALPPEIQQYEKTLRDLGLGSYVNEFETTLNRAAERAVPQAKDIFVNAVSDMSVEDVVSILGGKQDDAATEYFRGKTEAQLRGAFLPEVKTATDAVGLTSSYKQIVSAAEPFIGSLGDASDLDAYVTQKAMDGLFVYIEKEEKDIRHNASARKNDVLKKVFGYFDQ